MIFGKEERILYGNRFNGTKGNGYQPIKKVMTNEEWFCNLDTEDKAREISDMIGETQWSINLSPKETSNIGALDGVGKMCRVHTGTYGQVQVKIFKTYI